MNRRLVSKCVHIQDQRSLVSVNLKYDKPQSLKAAGISQVWPMTFDKFRRRRPRAGLPCESAPVSPPADFSPRCRALMEDWF